MADENKNHFILRKLYPDTRTILKSEAKSIEEIFKDALFVLDTNSLLAPYKTGKENIEKIRKVYENLIVENRIFIPAHVLREFANNRSDRISDLFSNIDSYLSTIPPIKVFEYPILSGLEAYKSLQDIIVVIKNNLKEYKQHLQDLKSGIVEWNWADPVSSMYSKTFRDDIIIEIDQAEDELINEYNERIKNNIPPGNKDKAKEGKDGNAIGDFVIWKTILKLGKEYRKSIVFVTNDEKNDWMLKGNEKSISTKFGLVDEFNRYTEGSNFICMTFSQFLENQGLEIDFKEDYLTNLLVPLDEPAEATSMMALNSLQNHISNLYYSIEPDIRFIHIDDPLFDIYIDLFTGSWRNEFHNSSYKNIYYNYFLKIETYLKEIKLLNKLTKSQNLRVIGEFTPEANRMVDLLKQFLDSYWEFMKIVHPERG